MPRLWDRSGKVIKDYNYLVGLGMPRKGHYGWTVTVYMRKYVDYLPTDLWCATWGSVQTKKATRERPELWLLVANRELRKARAKGHMLEIPAIVHVTVD